MCRGFAVVQRNMEVGNAARGTLIRVKWQCIHYGEKIANKRGLEKYVERDKEG
jgi:hypothetical protein